MSCLARGVPTITCSSWPGLSSTIYLSPLRGRELPSLSPPLSPALDSPYPSSMGRELRTVCILGLGTRRLRCQRNEHGLCGVPRPDAAGWTTDQPQGSSNHTPWVELPESSASPWLKGATRVSG